MVHSNLFLWGIHSKTFSFWNETTGELIFEHNCGGANRIWDFYVPEESPSQDTISVNGELDHVPRNTRDLHAVTQGAWLMYTSKSEVFQSPSHQLTKVTFPQTRHQNSSENNQKRQPWPGNPLSNRHSHTDTHELAPPG